ncbi:MAG: penicillin acylase family protein [Bacillota bacterium]
METSIPKLSQRKTHRWKKIALWSGAVLVVLLVVGFIGGNLFLSRGLPKTSGEMTLVGLSAPVQLIRDSYGVPHVKAKNEQDLYIAQGYIQAQDRLFQMDLSRRQASGWLSEVIGDSTVNNDKFFRTLGLRRAAEASYDQYTESGKAVLGWFTDGVNLYMEELRKSNKWPVEFTLLGYKPEPWTPVDSLTIGKYMAHDLGGHWENQAFRQYLLQNFS